MARYRYRPARYYNDYAWHPYVPAAARRLGALRQTTALAKQGRTLSPVTVDGRAIATTFWGKAWCENLEQYSDYANRLPRGRTYVRNGSVLDLQIASGLVTALVSGTSVYTIEARVAAVSKPLWDAICRDCAGAIDSLVELLQGRLSTGVMERICRDQTGLFPTPREIAFSCSCPDWASMCKHVAAVLYGIGARLDASPDLLFILRNVDAQDLISHAGTILPGRRSRPGTGRVLDENDLGAMFDIEMAPVDPSAPKTRARKPTGATAERKTTKSLTKKSSSARAPARRRKRA